eukprot:SAG31_NODE_8634_length_1417_cov_0.889226_2_plen_254_part_01
MVDTGSLMVSVGKSNDAPAGGARASAEDADGRNKELSQRAILHRFQSEYFETAVNKRVGKNTGVIDISDQRTKLFSIIDRLTPAEGAKRLRDMLIEVAETAAGHFGIDADSEELLEDEIRTMKSVHQRVLDAMEHLARHHEAAVDVPKEEAERKKVLVLLNQMRAGLVDIIACSETCCMELNRLSRALSYLHAIRGSGILCAYIGLLAGTSYCMGHIHDLKVALWSTFQQNRMRMTFEPPRKDFEPEDIGEIDD